MSIPKKNKKEKVWRESAAAAVRELACEQLHDRWRDTASKCSVGRNPISSWERGVFSVESVKNYKKNTNFIYMEQIYNCESNKSLA